MLCLSEAGKLLEHDYLPVEAGWGLTADNMAHVAASTYMPNCTAAMVDWWFGFIHTTEQYSWWHPQDHVSSDWDGPRENRSEYIGGHHLVEEYLGGELQKLKISFKDPSEYFGSDWKEKFRVRGYGTAVCGRTAVWDIARNDFVYSGHLIHLIKNEANGCRMRSRFWMGDIDGVENLGPHVPSFLTSGLCKHATEEMSILASKLPGLYEKYRRQENEKL